MKPKEYSRCLICHRQLKNPEFRKVGMGKKCMEKYNKKAQVKAVQLEMNFG